MFLGSKFTLTGVLALGEHNDIEKEIESVGGTVLRPPSRSACYVIVGTLPTLQWATADAGRKLLTALEIREVGFPVHIVGEDYFVHALLAAQNAPGRQPVQKAPGFPWDEMLATWLAPLREDGVAYEYSISKAMVSVHLPKKPKERLCTIRFGQYGPTSIDIPGILTDQLPLCWDNGEHYFDAVAEKRLSQDVPRALKEQLNRYK